MARPLPRLHGLKALEASAHLIQDFGRRGLEGRVQLRAECLLVCQAQAPSQHKAKTKQALMDR